MRYPVVQASPLPPQTLDKPEKFIKNILLSYNFKRIFGGAYAPIPLASGR